MIKARVTDIEWDMPDDGPTLATSWTVTVEPAVVAQLGAQGGTEAIEDAIVDEVSNRTGWCIRGCSIEILN
jgi:hypothetical protein